MKTTINSALKATLLILGLVIIAACQPSASEQSKKPASDNSKKPAQEQAKPTQAPVGKPGDVLLKDSEEQMFAFTTEKGKRLVIAKDKEDKYIIYRFGKPGNVEFEYPPNGKDSYKFMTYSYHMSPRVMDLNYLRFTSGDFMYIVRDESSGGERYIGIKLIDEKNGKEYDIKGIEDTREGSLIDLRFMNRVKSDMFTL